MAQHHRVEPAGATTTTGVGAVLMTDIDERITDLVSEFRGERTSTDTGDIGLGDADHRVDIARTDTGTHTRSAGDGVRGGHERIGAVIEIEEGGLCTFEQHVLTGLERVMHHTDRITDHRSKTRRAQVQILISDGVAIQWELVEHLGEDGVLLL